MNKLFALALLCALSACSGGHPAFADAESPLPPSQQCQSFEEFSGRYPDSKFTKLSAAEVTAFINKYPDPGNEVVVLYSTPYPKDTSYMNVFGYSAKGCFVSGAQLPADLFETVIHGGQI